MSSRLVLTLLLALGGALALGRALPLRAAESAAPEPTGHLILQIEGDANALAVTRITRKPDPCGVARQATPHAIVVRDAQGRELGRAPLDLSAFDLDAARVGQPLRVEGCMVRDTRVAMLANVPHWPTAASVELVHGAQTLGVVAADAYAALLAVGGGR